MVSVCVFFVLINSRNQRCRLKKRNEQTITPTPPRSPAFSNYTTARSADDEATISRLSRMGLPPLPDMMPHSDTKTRMRSLCETLPEITTSMNSQFAQSVFQQQTAPQTPQSPQSPQSPENQRVIYPTISNLLN